MIKIVTGKVETMTKHLRDCELTPMSVRKEAYKKKPGKRDAEEFEDTDIEILPGPPPKRIIGPAVKANGPSKSSTITPKSQTQFIIQKTSVVPFT